MCTVTWLLLGSVVVLWGSPHSHVWHDPFMRVIRLIHMCYVCHMTHSHSHCNMTREVSMRMRHEWSMYQCVWDMNEACVNAYHTSMRMTHQCVWHMNAYHTCMKHVLMARFWCGKTQRTCPKNGLALKMAFPKSSLIWAPFGDIVFLFFHYFEQFFLWKFELRQ